MMRRFTWNRFPIKVCDWFLAYSSFFIFLPCLHGPQFE